MPLKWKMDNAIHVQSLITKNSFCWMFEYCWGRETKHQRQTLLIFIYVYRLHNFNSKEIETRKVHYINSIFFVFSSTKYTF